jgi:anti-sigma factor RsiW
MEISKHNCSIADTASQIAAYLDGQLDELASAQFDAHLETCQHCRIELNAQRQFLCELDSALATPKELEIPKDFARVVSARAASDMRGVRQTNERRRALLVCVTLMTTAFALLGATNGKSLILSGRLLLNKVLGILTLLWVALSDAFLGLAIVARVIVRMVLPQSPVTSLAAFMLLALAVGSLSHLIIGYHRRGQMRLFD